MFFASAVYYGFCFIGLVGAAVLVIMITWLSYAVFRGTGFVSLKTFMPAVFLVILLLWLSDIPFAGYVVVAIAASVALGGAMAQTQRISPVVKSFVRRLLFGVITFAILCGMFRVFVQNILSPYKHFWLVFIASGIVCAALSVTLFAWYYCFFLETITSMWGAPDEEIFLEG